MKRQIMAFLLVGMFFVSNANALQETKYTFDMARQTALKNSQEIKLQDDIINSISSKNDVQKKNYLQNKPDYEYDGINKIEIYSNTYKTYDYEKILKNNIQTKKEMIISNEKNTLTLFTNIMNYKNEIKNKQMQINDMSKSVEHSSIKLKSGMITQVQHDILKNSLSSLQSELKNLNSKLELEEKRFKEHLGIDLSTKISLELVEPKLDQLLPKDALDNAQKNKKVFIDLQESLKELNDDMKWIQTVNIGANYQKYTKEQQKLIDEKQKDIKELQKNTLYDYEVSYHNILIKANEISIDKINKLKLEMNRKQLLSLYNQGYEKSLSIDEIDTQIEENILSQIKKQLEIRWLVLNYENSLI